MSEAHPDSPAAAPAALGEVWAEHRIPLMAALTSRLGDIDRAEEALSDAVLRAQQSWAVALPQNPSGWLYRVALNAARDRLRRVNTHRANEPMLEYSLTVDQDEPDLSFESRLALFQRCADPSLSQDQQIALMLFHLGGLSCKAIGDAFLAGEAVIYQRLSRARAKLRGQTAPPDALTCLSSIRAALEVIYLQSYGNLAGGAEADALGQDALQLTEALCEASPTEAENWALLAFLTLLEARRPARLTQDGFMIPLWEQDPSCWRSASLKRAAEVLKISLALGDEFGTYGIRAQIEMTRMRAIRDGEVRDGDLLALHDLWLDLTDQPFAAIERALILARVEDAQAGLKALDELLASHDMTGHAGWHLAKAELHEHQGELSEARLHLNAALSRLTTSAERAFVKSKIERLPA